MFMQTKNMHFNFAGRSSLAQSYLSLVSILSHATKSIMFHIVLWYDLYMYTPLQTYLSPYMARIPRCIQIGDKNLTVFNANIVTYSRTLLIIPIAWCLKFNYPIFACLLVFLHNFLDHVDGIVAKVQKHLYGDSIDDALLGGLMNVFCGKIVNIFSLWTILQEIHFEQTSFVISIGFILLCYSIIALETAICIVRIQNYFRIALNKNKTSSQSSSSAGIEEKLKEIFHSIGLAFLCLSTGYLSPFDHWSGIIGILCLLLTIQLAYLSLIKRLQIQEIKKTVTIELPTENIQKINGILKEFNSSIDTKSYNRSIIQDSLKQENEKQKYFNTRSSLLPSPRESSSNILQSSEMSLINQINNNEEDKNERSNSTSSSDDQEDPSYTYQRSTSLPAIWIDGRADKVYTIGCFDLFHEGHRLLLQRMRQFGREVIVGVHDSRSIHKLKNRVPVDGTEVRMLNVKRYADQVYCVSGTDPSNFVKCAVHLRENETAIYIRGDDMAGFPSRHVVEELMPIKFLPYTTGVSSTKIRQELFSHIQANDLEHLEKVN